MITMQSKMKKCKYCKQEYDIKSKGRIVLEFWRDPKHLSRLYFCNRNCFVSFLKDKKII
ncbi:MAG: hypothetical protein ACXQTP_01230 [Candidatus Methanofastidiosia archaeon]